MAPRRRPPLPPPSSSPAPADGEVPPPSSPLNQLLLSGGGVFAVFVNTSLETHLAVPVCDHDTVEDFKQKLKLDHALCFPDFGEIYVQAIKVRRGLHSYHLPDSMTVRSAFEGIPSSWLLDADVQSMALVQTLGVRSTGESDCLNQGKSAPMEEDFNTPAKDEMTRKKELVHADARLCVSLVRRDPSPQCSGMARDARDAELRLSSSDANREDMGECRFGKPIGPEKSEGAGVPELGSSVNGICEAVRMDSTHDAGALVDEGKNVERKEVGVDGDDDVVGTNGVLDSGLAPKKKNNRKKKSDSPKHQVLETQVKDSHIENNGRQKDELDSIGGIHKEVMPESGHNAPRDSEDKVDLDNASQKNKPDLSHKESTTSFQGLNDEPPHQRSPMHQELGKRKKKRKAEAAAEPAGAVEYDHAAVEKLSLADNEKSAEESNSPAVHNSIIDPLIPTRPSRRKKSKTGESKSASDTHFFPGQDAVEKESLESEAVYNLPKEPSKESQAEPDVVDPLKLNSEDSTHSKRTMLDHAEVLRSQPKQADTVKPSSHVHKEKSMEFRKDLERENGQEMESLVNGGPGTIGDVAILPISKPSKINNAQSLGNDFAEESHHETNAPVKAASHGITTGEADSHAHKPHRKKKKAASQVEVLGSEPKQTDTVKPSPHVRKEKSMEFQKDLERENGQEMESLVNDGPGTIGDVAILPISKPSKIQSLGNDFAEEIHHETYAPVKDEPQGNTTGEADSHAHKPHRKKKKSSKSLSACVVENQDNEERMDQVVSIPQADLVKEPTERVISSGVVNEVIPDNQFEPDSVNLTKVTDDHGVQLVKAPSKRKRKSSTQAKESLDLSLDLANHPSLDDLVPMMGLQDANPPANDSHIDKVTKKKKKKSTSLGKDIIPAIVNLPSTADPVSNTGPDPVPRSDCLDNTLEQLNACEYKTGLVDDLEAEEANGKPMAQVTKGPNDPSPTSRKSTVDFVSPKENHKELGIQGHQQHITRNKSSISQGKSNLLTPEEVDYENPKFDAAASSDSTEDIVLDPKKRYRIQNRNVASKRIAENLADAKNTSIAIFSFAQGGTSEDEYAYNDTKPSPQDSSSSFASSLDSETKSGASHGNTSDIDGGALSQSRSKGLPFADILKGSRSYKKTKTRLSQQPPEDDMVPESEPQ